MMNTRPAFSHFVANPQRRWWLIIPTATRIPLISSNRRPCTNSVEKNDCLSAFESSAAWSLLSLLHFKMIPSLESAHVLLHELLYWLYIKLVKIRVRSTCTISTFASCTSSAVRTSSSRCPLGACYTFNYQLFRVSTIKHGLAWPASSYLTYKYPSTVCAQYDMNWISSSTIDHSVLRFLLLADYDHAAPRFTILDPWRLKLLSIDSFGSIRYILVLWPTSSRLNNNWMEYLRLDADSLENAVPRVVSRIIKT